MDGKTIIRGYFTEKHYSNEILRALYIEPIVEEFGLLSDYAEMLQIFGTIDEVPDKFLPDLAQEMAYELREDKDRDVQREIVKRILTLYKDRAKEESIYKVLQSSTDDNWVGGNLTFYGGKVIKGEASITIPRDYIYTHDVSIRDNGDHYQDYFHYNDGVLQFEAEFINDRTYEMLELQVPGGVRWEINQVIYIIGPDGPVIYTTEFVDTDYLEDLTFKNKDVYAPEEASEYDSYNPDAVLGVDDYLPRSGRFVTMLMLLECMGTYAKYWMYPTLDVAVPGFADISRIQGIRTHDENSWDDGVSREGPDEGLVTLYARYRELLPYDPTYSLDTVIDDVWRDNNPSMTFGFIIEEES